MTPPLHTNATIASLHFIRTLVLACWVVVAMQSELYRIASVAPVDAHPVGVMALLPDAVYFRLVTSSTALALLQGLLAVVAIAAIAMHRNPHVLLATALLATIHESIVRAPFYMFHATVSPLLMLYVLTIFGYLARRPSNKDASTTLTVMAFVFALGYAFTGIRRIAFGGVALFSSGVPAYWFLSRGIDGPLGFTEVSVMRVVVEYPWMMTSLYGGFVWTTIAEILAPFALFSRSVRYVVLLSLIGFHVFVFVAMDIPFVENLLLMALLVDFHRWVSPREAVGEPPVVFFDGVCGMCNFIVDRLVRWDTTGVLRFAPLQGETAETMLGKQEGDPLGWAIEYVDEQGKHSRSTAALRIMVRLGWPYQLAGMGSLVPASFRDIVYEFVAKRRYRWFGKRDACRLPSAAERARFLP